jgi:hypothetical protein
MLKDHYVRQLENKMTGKESFKNSLKKDLFDNELFHHFSNNLKVGINRSNFYFLFMA